MNLNPISLFSDFFSSESLDADEQASSLSQRASSLASDIFSNLIAAFFSFPERIFHSAYGMPLANFCASIEDVSPLQTLQEMNFTVTTPDKDGLTPLHYAAKRGKFKEMRCLLQFCKDLINAQDKQGKTPLHYAVERSNVLITKYLLKQEASQTLADSFNKTPLDYATDQKIKKVFSDFTKQV